MVAITSDEVRRIARLARVGLSDAEVERLRDELSAILDHFSVLDEIDTEDVPPTAHSFEMANVQRADDVRPSLSTEDVLLNAPRTEDGFFRVRAVLD